MSAAEIEAIALQAEGTGLWSDAWRRLRRNPGAIFGMVVIGIFVFLAIFAPLIAPYDPREQNLDLGLGRSVWRVTRRAWRRWRSRELLWGTNTETFAKHLKLWDPAESLITFAVLSHRRRRPGMLARRHDPRWAHIHFVRLRSPREVERWLEAVTRPPRTRPAT